MPDSERPTWRGVVGIAASLTQHKFTRQSLESKNKIKKAYDGRVDAYRKRITTGRSEHVQRDMPKSLGQKDREEQLVYRASLEEYDAMLVRIIANAMQHGVSAEQLEANLPPRRRGRSDGG